MTNTTMTPYLPHEVIVSHILPRIPISSLLKFMCVCKAWRDAIGNDDSFHRAHLRRQTATVLVAPMIRNSADDRRAPAMVSGLYRWNHTSRPGAAATPVHAMADSFFFPRKWEPRHDLAHCDGLVLISADDGEVRVLNPATRRVLPLPPSPRVVKPRRLPPDFKGHQAFGLGRDPRSSAYKVARFFHHFLQRGTGFDIDEDSFGMEVLTIGKDKQWRQTAAPPPHPIMAGRTATFFKGSLLWTPPENHHASGFIRFDLEDESFSVTPPPEAVLDYAASSLAEVGGELCLCVPHQGIQAMSLELWMCSDLGRGNQPPHWDRRYFIDRAFTFHGRRYFRLVAVVDEEIVFEADSDHLMRYDSRSGEVVFKGKVLMNDMRYRNNEDDNTRMVVEYIDTIPYVESLVPL